MQVSYNGGAGGGAVQSGAELAQCCGQRGRVVGHAVVIPPPEVGGEQGRLTRYTPASKLFILNTLSKLEVEMHIPDCFRQYQTNPFFSLPTVTVPKIFVILILLHKIDFSFSSGGF